MGLLQFEWGTTKLWTWNFSMCSVYMSRSPCTEGSEAGSQLWLFSATSTQKGCMRTNQEVKTVFAVYQCISYPEEGLWSAKGLWTRRWESCGCKKMVREKEGWLSGYGNSQSKVMECVRLKGEEAGWEVNEN